MAAVEKDFDDPVCIKTLYYIAKLGPSLSTDLSHGILNENNFKTLEKNLDS